MIRPRVLDWGNVIRKFPPGCRVATVIANLPIARDANQTKDPCSFEHGHRFSLRDRVPLIDLRCQAFDDLGVLGRDIAQFAGVRDQIEELWTFLGSRVCAGVAIDLAVVGQQ